MSFCNASVLTAFATILVTSSVAFAQGDMKAGGMQTNEMKSDGMRTNTMPGRIMMKKRTMMKHHSMHRGMMKKRSMMKHDM